MRWRLAVWRASPRTMAEVLISGLQADKAGTLATKTGWIFAVISARFLCHVDDSGSRAQAVGTRSSDASLLT